MEGRAPGEGRSGLPHLCPGGKAVGGRRRAGGSRGLGAARPEPLLEPFLLQPSHPLLTLSSPQHPGPSTQPGLSLRVASAPKVRR